MALASGDFDGDGVADLVIGYGLSKGGSIVLLRGNLDAHAPQTQESWLAAGRREFSEPFLQGSEPIRVETVPSLLIAADVNGDGHLDLVYAAQGGGQINVMFGNGAGKFSAPISTSVAGGVTALASYRPGAPLRSEAILAGYQTKQGAGLSIVTYHAGAFTTRATYALPGAATSMIVANLDADFIPDTAVVASGQLLILHGKNALSGGGSITTVPVDNAEAVTAGQFLFDRHAQLQLSVLTTNGDVVTLAHQGFDPTPYTPQEIAKERRATWRHSNDTQTPALRAGNTGDTPWVEVDRTPTAAARTANGTSLLLRTRSAGGLDGLVVLDASQQQRILIRHSPPLQSGFSAAAQPAVRVTSSGLSSGNVIAAMSAPVSPDASDGLVALNAGSVSPDITVPSIGNTFYVNTTADNTGTTTDPPDAVRCSNGGSEACTLRDAITYANSDAAGNISGGMSDTIMVPAGAYNLTWQAGTLDSNGNAVTHLEVLGPVTIIGVSGSTIINGNNNDTIFTINPGPFGSFNPSGNSYIFNATLENLIIENGRNNNNPVNSTTGNFNNVGGCINWDAYSSGNLTITNSVVENCAIEWGTGGGIWAFNSIEGTGRLILNGDTIHNNSTPEQGGGLYIAFPPAAVSITNTVFSANEAAYSVNPSDPGTDGEGGGMFFTARDSAVTPQSMLTGVTIQSNTTVQNPNTGINNNGGGILTFTGLLISGSIFSNNSAAGYGGGIWSNPASDGSPVTITSSNFLSNTGVKGGGAIAMGEGETGADGNILQVGLSRIVGNTSANGASGLADGVSGLSGAGEATATDNWWGCNDGPTTPGDGCDQAVLYDSSTGSLKTAPYAQLGFTSDITTIPPGGSMNLSVSLNKGSDGNPISGAFPAVATNYPFTYDVTGLTASPALTTGTFNTSGVGTAVLTPVTPSSTTNGSVTVTFDNQTDTINFTAQVISGPATHFSISAPATVTSNTAFSVTVTALDASNGIATGYTGMVHFTSNDPRAVLPADATLTNGVGTFSVTLKTSGGQMVTATDTVSSSITGSTSIQVNPGSATHFIVSAPATASPGTAFNFNVTASDSSGNVATGYTGTVHFTSSDSAAVLPANSTLTNGAGTFSATLNTAGNQTITATDTVTTSVTGTSGPIAVTASTSISVLANPNPVVSGQVPAVTATITPTGAANGTIADFSALLDGTQPMTVTSLGGNQFQITSPALSNLNIGVHTIAVSFSGNTNYLPSTGSAPLTVNKASQTITFPVPATPVTYGVAPIALNATASTVPPGAGCGLPVSYSATGPATLSGSTLTITGVGSVVVTAMQVGNANCAAATPVQRTIQVNQAVLTVTPANETKLYGAALPALTGSITGLVNNDAITATYATTATAASPVGTYPITATLNDPAGRLPNYSVTLNQGTLTVTQNALTVTANNGTKVYGTANPTFTGTLAGAVNGDVLTESFSTTATLSSGVGTYPIVPSVTGTNLSDYAVTIVNGTLTVTQAPTTTTLNAITGTVTPGESITLTAQVQSTSQGAVTGNVNFYDGTTLLGTAPVTVGSASLTITLTPGITNSLTAAYQGNTDFAPSTSVTPVTVPFVALDFSLNTEDIASVIVTGGATVPYTFGITPTYGTYPAEVTFSAIGLPPGATATFTPSTIAANGGAQLVSLQIKTQPTTARKDNPFQRGKATLALSFLLLPLIGTRRMRNSRLGRSTMLLLVLAAGAIGLVSLSGCGSASGFKNQTAQNYTVTVMATSGSDQHSFDITLGIVP